VLLAEFYLDENEVGKDFETDFATDAWLGYRAGCRRS
jgi:hypothetical protein